MTETSRVQYCSGVAKLERKADVSTQDVALGDAIDAAAAVAELRRQHAFLLSLCDQVRRELDEVIDVSSQPSEVRRVCASLQANLSSVEWLARLQEGDGEPVEADFDLHTVARTAVASEVFVADMRGVRLRCYVHRETPRRVTGDAALLRHVISVLLGSVIANSDGGDVAVYVALEHSHGGLARVRVTIRDRHVGAADGDDDRYDFVDRELHATAPPWVTPWFESLGELVARMGGSLGFVASDRGGVAVWCTATLGVAQPRPQRIELAPHLPVLLVSNVAEHVPVVMIALQRGGFVVELEEDYRQLPARMQRSQYGLVLVDRQDGAHVATFAARPGSGDVRLVPVLGLPRVEGFPQQVDEEALVRLVRRHVGAATSGS